jgi:hypothetical protein
MTSASSGFRFFAGALCAAKTQSLFISMRLSRFPGFPHSSNWKPGNRPCSTVPRPRSPIALPRQVYPSGGHLQSPAHRLRWRVGHLPLEGLRARQQKAQDDHFRRRAPTALPAAHSAAWFRPHPFLWIHGGPRRSRMLQLARGLLETGVECGVSPATPTPTAFHCPVCATPMIVVERLTAAMVRRAADVHLDDFNNSS